MSTLSTPIKKRSKIKGLRCGQTLKRGVTVREKVIEQYFVAEVKKLGGIALKLNSTSMNGLPDRLILLPNGVLFFAELKSTGKKARPLQRFIHQKLQSLGFIVYVIDSMAQVKKMSKNLEG